MAARPSLVCIDSPDAAPLIGEDQSRHTTTPELPILQTWAPATDSFSFDIRLGISTPDIPAIMLRDTGCSGMVISSSFITRYNLPVTMVTPRTINFAGDATQTSNSILCDREITLNVQINKYFTAVKFAVCDIAEDVIFGIPFETSITVIYTHWAIQKFCFRTLSGTNHTWYGVNHRHRRNLTKPVFLCRTIQLADDDEIFEVHVKDISAPDSLHIHSITSITATLPTPLTPEEDLKSFLASQPLDMRTVLAPYLHSVFSVNTPSFKDIPERVEDMHITDKPDTLPPKPRPLRRLSPAEEEALRSKLEDLLAKGYIRPSSSTYGSAVLFAKKKDGGLRLCVDYRAVNSNTVRDQTPLPSHVELRDCVQGSKYLSKLDIRDAFHMIRINSADCHKTAFRTKFGSYEYTVCPFGLTNSPATFMRLMNRIFGDLAGRKLIYYVDDILLFSATYEEHLQLIDTVLSRLATNLLCVKLPKCVFAVQTLEFCGMVVSTKGIHLDQSHLDAMWDYPQITSATDISKFMGSVRFFADFIPWLADIASPLFDLTKAHAPFTWTTDHQTIVRVIQYYLSHAPVLRYFDPTLPTHVHMDASKFAIGGWLGQIHPDGKEYVVSYWSRRMIPAELNYPVHNRNFSLFTISYVLTWYCFYGPR